LEPDGIGTVPFREVAGVSKGHIPPPLWMRTAMSGEVYADPRQINKRIERGDGARVTTPERRC
jgi:hypothetical protein